MSDVELNMKVSPSMLAAETRLVAASAIEDACQHVLNVSNMRVPIQEGHLEKSGDTVVDRTELKGYIFYDQPYAVRQHEELDYRHAPGRTAKYLELAAQEEAGTVETIIATRLREITR
ncbi:hypothetical protein AB0C10_15785 [Microbispora amethystogenes]|uniref:hypothetical protein n=1 Tax=Microbispora amethystogenes TaxID=1427754 RepID=UPI0033E0F8C5